jgi:N-formylmaleamate deformylase
MLPSHWIQDELLVNSVRLHYYRTGDGSKPPLVLAHGFSDNGLCWLQTARDLEADYDIIMPDARGHGLSERVIPGQSVDMVSDLVGIIQALDLQHPFVGGHSMGAMVTFQLGVRYPEIPRALLLEDPPWRQNEGRTTVRQTHEPPMSPWVETVKRLTLDELIAQTRRDHPNWPEWVIQTWCTAKKQLDPNILSILRIRDGDWPEGVPQITCPTLIVTADPEKGGIVTPEVAARVHQLNPLCQVAHIPGTGHHVRFEAYATYMEVIQTFFHNLK